VIGERKPVLADEEDTVTVGDGVVCWMVTSANEQVGHEVKVVLIAEKPGKTPFRGEQAFPAGTTAPTIAAHFVGLLVQAGWTDPRDYDSPAKGGPCILLFGVSRIGGGVDGTGVRAVWTITKTAPRGRAPTGAGVSLTRGTNRQAGRVDLCALGIASDVGSSTIATSSACSSVHFTAEDSVGDILSRMETTLEDEGWTVERSLMDGRLNILGVPVSRHGIVMLQLAVESPGKAGGERVHDRWILEPSP